MHHSKFQSGTTLTLAHRSWRAVFGIWLAVCLAVCPVASAQQQDDLDSLLDNPNKKDKGTGIKSLLKEDVKRIAAKALSRVKLTESPELKRIREREPEPGPGKLIYKDNFESYKHGDTPKYWPARTCSVAQIDTPGNKTRVLKFAPSPPYWAHCYMDREIHATNFRLKFDFLCGQTGEVTWLGRLNGNRGTSLWENENYYQIGFYTKEGQPLSFGARHLWVGGGYPFVDAPQPGVTTEQPSFRQAWHSAEIVIDDDRLILKLNGVRVLDGHYPVLMARTRKNVEYGFGLMGRDSVSSSPKAQWVFNEWYDNVEIYDLGTPVRERRWPRKLHVATWGDDSNTGTDPAHPWRTLRKAFSELGQGDRLTLQAGTYDEDVTWVDPVASDAPTRGATLAEYPTVIQASPHEQVTIKGAWQFANAGWLRVEDLTFAGEEHGLSITASGSPIRQVGQQDQSPARVSLRRLTFRDQSAGLALDVNEACRAECGRSLFLDGTGGLVVAGDGEVTLARCVLNRASARDGGTARVRFVHCTLIGESFTGGDTAQVNCLAFNSMAEAAKALHDPAAGRFDPKPGTVFLDVGKSLPVDQSIPGWADMPTAGKPDLGAVEYYPPRNLKCHMVMEKEDLLSDEPIVVPMPERAKAINDAIKALRPGDTLRVSPGLWTESGLALTNLRGEPNAPIRIVSDPPLGAIVHGTVRFSNCNHVYLEGFRIAGYQGRTPKKVGAGVEWQNCGRTWVVGCEITEFGHTGVAGDEQGVTLLRNWIHHNGVGGLNHGIYWAGEGPSWVIGNTFYGNAGWGFHNHQAAYDGWRGWKHNVHHNLFIGPGGAIVTTGSRGTYFNNTIIRPSNASFWFYNDGHRDNLIANNIIVDGANGVHTRDGNLFSHNLTFGPNETLLGKDPVKGDPLFVDGKAHNYRLKPQSPAINAGTPVGLSDDQTPTLGAYDGNEQWAPPGQIPVYVPEALKQLNKELKELDVTGDIDSVGRKKKKLLGPAFP